MGMRSHPARMVLYGPMLVATASFLLGGLCGSALAAFSLEESAQQLGLYLNEYLELLQRGEAVWSVPFAAWHHGRWLLVCALLGMTWLGVIILPLLFAVRAFLLAFGIGCFIRFLGEGGLILAACLFGLPALFWVPAFLMMGSRLLENSAERLWHKKGQQSVPGKTCTRRCVVVSIILLCVCVAVECNVLPVLLPLAAQIFG